MLINFDFGAALGVGSAFVSMGVVIAGLFWRLMSRIERKVDHVVDHMTTREQCSTRMEAFQKMFNGHDHTKEGDLVIIRREHGPVYQQAEELPDGRSEVVIKRPGKGLGSSF